MNPKRLTSEDKVLLKELTSMDGYRTLIKVLDLLLVDKQNALLNCDNSDGTERVMTLKAEYDGAKKYLASLKLALAGLRK